MTVYVHLWLDTDMTTKSSTATATSTYGTVREVTINEKGIVFTTNGVLLGDVEGMELQGWEFAK